VRVETTGHRTLLLGGGGFLGARVALACERASTGSDGAGAVIACARTPVPLLAGLRRVRTRPLDARAPGALEELLDELRPTRVLNAAALSRGGDCERDPALAQRLNADLPGQLARAARERGFRLVHVSTDLVFGGRPPQGERFAEDEAPSPVDVYGRSKVAGEERVLAADPSACVVRLPLLYGDSCGREIGASDALLAALARGERPLLFEDEHRTPLDVDVAACALLEVLETEASGVLHVAGAERLSRWELGLLVVEHLGDPTDRARLRRGTRADVGLTGRAADASLDGARARELLATPLPGPAQELASRRSA
jgi:dTDP-4-dehydrorhamnose reductase